MPDLRIQTNIDNGDLPEQLELFEEYDSKKMWKEYLRYYYKHLFNILDKERLKEFLKERDNK